MEKINIAELLKDCPKGMELYSPLCGKCAFDHINFGTIICKTQNNQDITFTCNGYYMLPVSDDCECVIFPSKDQRDWSKFKKSFNDGDIVATTTGNWIGITKGGKKGVFIPIYCVIKSDGEFEAYFDREELWAFNRLATEEEKQKLFDAIKANGYKWNTETKTLERFPMFKVGDRIQWCGTHINHPIRVVKSLECDRYRLDNGGYIKLGYEYAYKLLKFDINTLNPFDKVLVAHKKGEWHIQFFEKYSPTSKFPFICIGGSAYQRCVPYEENKHLMDTTNDCDEYFKVWK